MSNDVRFTYTPFWLFSLSDTDRDDVQTWLTTAGVNLNLCPGFDYDGALITTRYYARDEMGSPTMSPSGDVNYEEQVREFAAPNAPQIIAGGRTNA